MSVMRKVLIGLVVVVALLLSGGVGYAVANGNGGSSDRPASGMMGGDMDQMRDRMAGRMGGRGSDTSPGMGRGMGSGMPGGMGMGGNGSGRAADGT